LENGLHKNSIAFVLILASLSNLSNLAKNIASKPKSANNLAFALECPKASIYHPVLGLTPNSYRRKL
jgi:hypothetical protein